MHLGDIRIHLSAIVVAGLWTTGLAWADCDSAINPVADSEIPYKKRGDRCEGFYEARVGADIALETGNAM